MKSQTWKFFRLLRKIQIHQQTKGLILVSYYQFDQVVQGIPAFRDFTIRDPRHFVILFEAQFHDFEEKIFFWNFFLCNKKILILLVSDK